MRIKRRPLLGNGNSRNVPANSRTYCYGCSISERSISEFWIPVGAAPLRCGVEQVPQHVEVGRTARILAGIGHHAAHLAGPEVADGAVAAGEHAVAGYIGIIAADIVARVVAGGIAEYLVPRPAARLLRRDQPFDRRARDEHQRDTLL